MARRPALLLFATAAIVLAADLLSKEVVVSTLRDRPPVDIVLGLRFTYTTNTGGAFGLSGGTPWLFGAASIAVSCYIVWYAFRVGSTLRALSLGLILGGALGNLASRLAGGIDLSGRVVDFIDVRIWPVFNLADSAIVIGAILLVLSHRGERPSR